MACPLPGNDMVEPAVAYCTVPSNVHPGIVLFAVNSLNGDVEFSGKFDGGNSKSGFCRPLSADS